MERYRFPTMSILVATATIGIASFATPVSAAPGYYTGVVGTACAGVGTNAGKLNHQSNGAVYNKNTSTPAVINCPVPLEYNRATTVYVTWIKRDAGTLGCTFHRRSFNYLSGATSTQSTNAVGSSYFQFNATTDYFNSVQCSIPKASGAGANQQSGVNGILWLN
ncbi:MAG TPA: hypothetical protein VNS57_05850 [Steroidobacteraceae bacterium]|nr:hypothetical protein [Steroidobacteraceae bacterium]